MNRDALMGMLGGMHATASALQQQIEATMRLIADDAAPNCPHPDEARDYQNGMSGDFVCGRCGYSYEATVTTEIEEG